MIYWPATGYDFVVVDDDRYVYENPWVTGGLSTAGLCWAFTSTYAANWHPLTWISHMLDCSLHGLFPGGHHLTNILLHSLNTLLLFLLLKRLTQELWPAALVAALFGWHPLHVESVAWVAERKDVLSTFFLLLTIWAYARYAERKTLPRYGVVFALFALGLMAKSMLVTVPCLLLLLDYWPLKRFQMEPTSPESPVTRTIVWNLFREKIPLFALSLLASVITVIAQHAGGAVKSFRAVPFLPRVQNAVFSYALYIWKTVYPVKLCIFYPLSVTLPGFWVAGAAVLIAGITGFSFLKRSVCPWLLVGWLWFLITLVPVIGLVQIGSQALADRYTYIPSIGLFVAAVWSVARRARRSPVGRVSGFLAATAALSLCLTLTRVQLEYWRDSIGLFTHALAVTGSNAFSENNLGVALSNAGRGAEAIPHYRAALRLKPDDLKAHYNLGVELAAIGELDEAVFHFSAALALNPNSEILHNNLGVVLAQQQRWDLAMDHFRQATQLNPRYPKPYLNRARLFQREGLAGLAATNYLQALDLEPDWPEAMDKLAYLLATCPETDWHNPEEAIRLAKRANEVTRYELPAYLNTLAVCYGAAGQFSNAVATAELAWHKAQADHLETFADTIKTNLQAYQAGKNNPNDWRNPISPEGPP
jgi:tetratricopeptide (TPR) repeat protein